MLAVTFFDALVFVAGQKALYVDLLRGLSKSGSGLRGERALREETTPKCAKVSMEE